MPRYTRGDVLDAQAATLVAGMSVAASLSKWVAVSLVLFAALLAAVVCWSTFGAQPTAAQLYGRWHIDRVTAGGAAQDVAPGVSARVEFSTNGELASSDSINALRSTYVLNGRDILVSRGSTTLALYGGEDPSVLAAIRAVEVLNGLPDSAGPARSRVVTVTEDLLVLDSGDLRVELGRVR